ncbi:hypothetical protein BV921_13015 [Pectobacterium odoriferum]|uniref:alkene reductase n=1 Tax=Pectobacterium odoriferum TaxID=78398 RepID=UPI00052A18D5|nr:alkene reductase [Pectobacterium odoriferum]AIU89028.1 hypothetical protein BCS7_13650 [Pectobacterium odoriferum]POD99700.1 hypothetical protein BVY05_14830 [Pectobacterium odoriferum]POE09447.1 hypothetical protein BV921_13015 [Pectobacterium odoriferum]POE17307.1 hypothetical protein BV918_14155 [Pectobacterium odoriferum]POE34825.1 hypothetical protein BV922_12775 [Pectobacterium odoriferum]
MKNTELFSPLKIHNTVLNNRIIMAPMTRARADDSTDIINESAAEYYAQRASAGLIVSEAVHINHVAKGFIQTPGIYNNTQVEAWKKVTDAVHENGGKIYIQLWHVGRMSHISLIREHAHPLAPSAMQSEAAAFTHEGSVPASPSQAMTLSQIKETIEDFRQAAINAKDAGFDGVEIHGANGFLIDQFVRDHSNTRADSYGGTVENRVRFAIEVATAVAEVWGAENVGFRISPLSKYGDMSDSDPAKTFGTLIEKLNILGLAYLHVIEDFPFAESSGALSHTSRDEFFGELRNKWKSTYIANGKFTTESAAAAIREGKADAVSFGRPFIANPDLVKRMEEGLSLDDAPFEVYYGGSDKGYTDY